MRTFRKWQEDVNAAPAQEPEFDNRATAQQLRASVGRLAVKEGDKRNKYMPLVRYCARNPQMTQLLDELMKDAATVSSSYGKSLTGQ